MKYIKRTLALLLAVVLVLALSISAFAVDTNGSIKVDNAVVNKTYTLYRIFDLDSHNTDYSAINYKVSAKWANFFVTGAAGLNYVTIDDMGYVTWKDGANAADFAAAAIAYAEVNGIANDGQQKATGSIVEFTNLPLRARGGRDLRAGGRAVLAGYHHAERDHQGKERQADC